MLTSLAEMLELPIFDLMVTCTILKIERLKKLKKELEIMYLKCNLYLCSLIKQNLFISGENSDVSRTEGEEGGAVT